MSIVDSNNPIATMLAAAQPDSLATQLQVLQSEPFLEDAERKAGIVPKPGIAGPSPNVEAVEDSNVIQITVRGGDPGDIAKLANAMVDLHLERTNIVETIGLDDTIQFVRKEKEKAARDLATAERKLLAFRRDHRIVELTAKEESEAKAYVALQAKVHETESNIISAKAQIAELRARLAREPLDIVQDTVKENPRRARLEEKRDELKIQRVELLQDFLPASQRIRALDERIARATQQREAEPETVRVRIHAPNPSRLPLQTRLTELEADLQGHVAVHNAVVAQFDARKGVVDSLGPWEVLQSRLTHDRDAVQAAFATFSDRLRDLEIRSRARIRTARVIERAGVPTAPIRPPTTTNIAFSAILALCLATGVAFLLEHLDDRVHSPEDVERLSALPTLGNVPLIGPDLPRLLATLPAKSHAAEAYRTLRSSIGFAGADAPIRRLVVTSPSKGEGKTVTSVNLATAMAADGKKVILVDADLRRPSVHRLLDRPITPGLSEVLVARKSLEEALQDTDIENLRVICAGSIPPNPAELLGAQSFRALLRDLGERA
ncbi:MAG: polysaccharide biosynthesis tyrosine autokinase, partial [Fimbriimonas ginsengisoli]|nr:polysaccharide biosynthesis tyrosine autokinase [Fimbriimonas ginsengisoli]